jgi:hypothetical protein
MPFQQMFPRSFSAPSVRQHAPAQSGVYGITNAREWLLIGAADNIQAALLGHLGGGDSPVLRERPTGFVFEVCGVGERGRRQDQLAREYGPTRVVS